MTARAVRLRLAHDAGRGRPTRTNRWALLIARKYGLTLPEARTELGRLAAHGWFPWEFAARFNNDSENVE